MPPAPSSPHTIAVFDLGSNAVRLTVYRIDGISAHIVTKAVELCEMGRAHDRPGYLYPEGVTRAIRAVERYNHIIRNPQHHCTGVIAVATEAVRRSVDGPDFIQRLHDQFGLDVRVLGETEEGALGARGVLRDDPGATGIVADLGGGSLQLTRIAHGTTHETYSMPLGTLRLLAAHNDMDRTVEDALATIPATLNTAENLYVIGGSWRSLAKLYLTRAGRDPRDVQGTMLDPAMVRALVTWLNQNDPTIQSALADTYHLEQSRAETLPHAGRLLTRLLDKTGARRIIVSKAGIRDGLLQAVIDGTLAPTPLAPRTFPQKQESATS